MDQIVVTFKERMDRLLERFVREASLKPTGNDIARETDYSLAQMHRLFRQSYGESPGAFRRRLILERSADLLRRTDAPVWRVAVDSGFETPEGFCRAFRRAFNVQPRAFRKSPSQGWLPAPSKVHYWRGSILRTVSIGGKKMNIIDRLVEHDLVDSRRLIERAQTLTPEQLDAPISDPSPRLFLECFDATIRDRLDYLVITKECWLAAVFGRPSPIEGTREKSPKGLLNRWTSAEAEWRDLVKNVEAEGKWDEKFIDALCDSPETFTFGGMIAHVLDQSARNRAEIVRAFAAIGHEDVAYGDPLTWEIKTA